MSPRAVCAASLDVAWVRGRRSRQPGSSVRCLVACCHGTWCLRPRHARADLRSLRAGAPMIQRPSIRAPSGRATHRNHGPPLAPLTSQIAKAQRLIASQDPHAARHAGEDLPCPASNAPHCAAMPRAGYPRRGTAGRPQAGRGRSAAGPPSGRQARPGSSPPRPYPGARRTRLGSVGRPPDARARRRRSGRGPRRRRGSLYHWPSRSSLAPIGRVGGLGCPLLVISWRGRFRGFP